jgi:hypothetical protein
VGPRRAAQIVGWHVDEVETPSSSTLTPAISAADRVPQLTTENAKVAL